MIEISLEDGVWNETALITITKESGSDIEYAAMTSSIKITEGGKPLDQVAFLDGSRGVVRKPAGPIEITFEGYPIDADASGSTGVIQVYDSQTTRDTTDPFIADSTTQRDRQRVSILWTDDTAATSGSGPTTASTNGLRYTLANCFCTSHDWDFTGDGLKCTFAFWAPAVSKAKTANRRIESVDGAVTTGILTTLQGYTTTVNW